MVRELDFSDGHESSSEPTKGILARVTGSYASPTAITAVGGITAAVAYEEVQYIVGSGGAVSVSANPQISAGTYSGQRLVLVGTSSTNKVTLADGNGLKLRSTLSLGAGDIAAFVWDAGQSLWRETSRSLLAGHPQWVKYTVTHTQLQAAALTNNIELFSLLANEVIHACILKHSEAFAGTSITAYTVSVGIGSDLDKYAAEFDVLQAVADGTKEVNFSMNLESFAAGTSIKIAATSEGANLDQSTAGSVDVWVLKSVLPSVL